jgi:hypothetical protein
MRNIVAQGGGLGKLAHIRRPTLQDQRTVIRMNLETLYSHAVFDLAAGPVTITVPAMANGRYVAADILNHDHLMPMVLHEGIHTLNEEAAGTRYVAAFARVFIDTSNPEDAPRAQAVQDAITATQDGAGVMEMPEWEKTSLDGARKSLLELGSLGTVGFSVQMGKKGEVDPIAHLIATAFGRGLNPPTEPIYLLPALATNDGATVHTLTMKDVPVGGFWSISVYNKDGFFEPDNLNGTKTEGGAITVRFGGCSAAIPANCIPITEGWNYVVRPYRPQAEVLARTWKLADAVLV